MLTTPPERQRRVFGNLYYGWIVVLGCNLVACITWGVAIFNQSVFVAYYASAYGWSPAVLSIGPVLFHLWAGVAGIIVGRVVDRQGPRLVLLTGAVLVCAAVLGFALVREIWHTVPVFLLLGTGFACIHTVTIGKIIARWFVQQRNRAMAAATFGAGVGGALLVPLNAYMIETYGLLSGCISLAIATAVVIVPCAIWVIRDDPEAFGPETIASAENTDNKSRNQRAAETIDPSEDRKVWTVAKAMQTVAFWGLSICFALGMIAQSSYLFHQVPYLQSTLGLVGAASVVTVTTLAGILGRFIFILSGNLLSPKYWTMIMFAVQATSFVVLAYANDVVGLTAGSALFGLTMGVVVTLQPLTTAYCFGQVSFGRIYGPIYFSIRMGAALGPGIAGVLLALSGNYFTAWLILAASLAVAAVMIPIGINKPVQNQ